MITEDYVSYEIAKLLKEKGSEGQCIAYYSKYVDNNSKLHRWRNRQTYVNVRNDGYTLVPTMQMAMKWLREVHNIAIQVFPVITEDTWCFDVYKKDDEGIWKSEPENLSDIDFGLCEECLNAALVYTLENLV